MIEKIAYLRNTYKNRRIEILIDYYILLYFLSLLFCFLFKNLLQNNLFFYNELFTLTILLQS